jgi:hypothetical protein
VYQYSRGGVGTLCAAIGFAGPPTMMAKVAGVDISEKDKEEKTN